MSDVSNSGGGACLASASGKRRDGVDMAVEWIGEFQRELSDGLIGGVDSFTVAWLHAGGSLVWHDEAFHFQGETSGLDPRRFSEVLKMQARVQEALKRGRINVVPVRLVDRSVRSVDLDGVVHTKAIKTMAYGLAEGDSDDGVRVAEVSGGAVFVGGDQCLPAADVSGFTSFADLADELG